MLKNRISTLLLRRDAQQTQSHFFSTLVSFNYKITQALHNTLKQIIRLNSLNNYIHELFIHILLTGLRTHRKTDLLA